MTVFMVSLAGIPPTGGFWAKLLVFQAAIERGGVGVGLAIVMLVNSVVSIVYYFAIPRAMLFNAPEREEPLSSSWLVNVVVVTAVIALLAIFVLPQAVAHLGDLSTLGGAAVGG